MNLKLLQIQIIIKYNFIINVITCSIYKNSLQLLKFLLASINSIIDYRIFLIHSINNLSIQIFTSKPMHFQFYRSFIFPSISHI